MNTNQISFVALSPSERKFSMTREWAKHIIQNNPPAFNLGGLVNLGNSCFMNSVLQCLAYTPGFKFFADHIPNEVFAFHMGKPFFLYHFSLLSQSLMSVPSTAPHVFFSNLTKICPEMEAGNQQDAHEYLLALLNKFDDEMKVMNDLEKNSPHSVFSFFAGILNQKLVCSKCHNIESSEQHFLDISLPLVSETIENCFQQLFSPTIIKDSYKCRNCGKNKTISKQMRISVPPNILIVTLIRFSSDGLKINKNVSFQLDLDLTEFCENKEKVEYELYAVIKHNGNQITRGHFSSFVQNSFGDWLNVDDCKVFSDTIESVLNSKPYVLFYKRKFPSNLKSVFCQFALNPNKT